MKLTLVIILLFTGITFVYGAEKLTKGFETANIALYQANDVLVERLPGGADQLADYIKKLQAVLTVYYADDTTPETLHTVVALRPGQVVHVWFVSSKRPGDAQEFEALRKQLEAVEPLGVREGPVVFAITGKLAGGDSADSLDGKNFTPPIPREWKTAAGELKPTTPLQDDYLNAVWPDHDSPSPAIDVPEGFVLQPLEATGGQIAMPKGWFYHQSLHGSKVNWVISKEDSTLGPYLTGLRIQFFAAVKEPSGGKTAQQFCQEFLDGKKKTAKVLTIFPERAEGMFTRQGLEDTEDITEAGVIRNYHIIYSVFWTNEKDMAVVTVSGTPTELWSQYEKTFNIMSQFQLLDMTKLGDASPAPEPASPRAKP